jgi:hypothetical protein
MMAGDSCQMLVACEQHRVQRFGQGDINGVIRRTIVPQRPNTRQQKIVWVALHAKIAEIVQCHAPAFCIYLALAAYLRMTCATSMSSKCGACNVCPKPRFSPALIAQHWLDHPLRVNGLGRRF